MENSGLISNFDEAREFAKHPIKPLDPFYTRDFDTWHAYFDSFKRFIIGQLKVIIKDLERIEKLQGDPNSSDFAKRKEHPSDLKERKKISDLYMLWYGTLKKIKQYDSASGSSLYVGLASGTEPFTRF